MVSTERSVREAVETIARPEHLKITNNLRSGETPDRLNAQPFRVSNYAASKKSRSGQSNKARFVPQAQLGSSDIPPPKAR